MSAVSSGQRTLAITGVDGFVGRHVAALAVADGWRVVGVSLAPAVDESLGRHLVAYHGADLGREWPVREPVDAVIHLAGLAAVGPSFQQPQRYIEANSAIVTTMCEALLGNDRPLRMVGVSTGGVYASDATGAPLDENATVTASSPYVVSKLLVEHQLEYYAHRGIDTVVVRPFNHIGPGQAAGFLVPDLTARLRELEPGAALTVGNLDTERDYTDVRDVARAYLLLAGAERHAHSTYNVASGRSLSGRSILTLIAGALGRELPALEVDPSRLRATDAARITGSAGRLHAEFGWTPTVSAERSVEDSVRWSER